MFAPFTIIIQELATHIIREGMTPLLMDHFGALPFEGRKVSPASQAVGEEDVYFHVFSNLFIIFLPTQDAAQIFNNLCRHNLGGENRRA